MALAGEKLANERVCNMQYGKAAGSQRENRDVLLTRFGSVHCQERQKITRQ